jgi:hypothetical protein
VTSLRGFTRTEFPKRVKAAAFARCCDPQGIPRCESCGIVLTGGNIVYEHVQPDGLGGEPTLENCKVFCRKICATRKTVDEDNPRMAKADRQLKANFGIRKRSTFACSRDSAFKKKIDGSVVRR